MLKLLFLLMLGASNICNVVVSSEDFLKVEDIHERILKVDKKTKPKTPKPTCIAEDAACKKWYPKAKKCCPGLSCVRSKLKGSKDYICSKGMTKPKPPKPTSDPTPVPSSKPTLPACIAKDAACKKWYPKAKKCCPGLSCVKPKLKGSKGYICAKGMTKPPFTKPPKPTCIAKDAACKKWHSKGKKCCPRLSCVPKLKGSKDYICAKGMAKPPSTKPPKPTCIAKDAACKKWNRKGKKCCPGLSCVPKLKGSKEYICSKGMTNQKPTAAPTPATTATPSAYVTDEPTMWQLNSTSTPTLLCGVMPDECGEGKEECCSGYTCRPVARGNRKGKGGKKVCVKVGTRPNKPKTPNPSKRKPQKCLKKDRSCQYKKGQCCEGLFCCNKWKCGKGVHGGKCVEKQPTKAPREPKPTSKPAICRAEDTACRSTAQCCEGFVCCNRWDKCGKGVWGGKCIKK